MIEVSAPCRLHLGLLRATPHPTTGRYGGAGFMLAQPRVVVRATPAERWSATGPDATRALAFAQAVTTECHCLEVLECPPAHCGLGSGTALALAIGTAVLPDARPSELARGLGRGLRTRIGVLGYSQGGLILDDPALAEATAHPCCAAWRVLILLPEVPPAWHGSAERAAFQQLASQQRDVTRNVPDLQDLCAANYAAFCTAVEALNAHTGSLFESVQGGAYAHASTATVIARLRSLGCRGVGQSSWGPGVFAIFPNSSEAEQIATEVRDLLPWREFRQVSIAQTGYRVRRV